MSEYHNLEFTLPWAKASSKSEQLELCRFTSNRMKSGKIVFRDDRWFEASRDVPEPILMSLYHRTKYRSKYVKIESVEIHPNDIDDEVNQIELKVSSRHDEK
jgi:hypothetical protein